MKRSRRRGRRRRGQAIVEYAILVAFLVMALAAVFGAFPTALRGYWGQIRDIISLPII